MATSSSDESREKPQSVILTVLREETEEAVRWFHLEMRDLLVLELRADSVDPSAMEHQRALARLELDALDAGDGVSLAELRAGFDGVRDVYHRRIRRLESRYRAYDECYDRFRSGAGDDELGPGPLRWAEDQVGAAKYLSPAPAPAPTPAAAMRCGGGGGAGDGPRYTLADFVFAVPFYDYLAHAARWWGADSPDLFRKTVAGIDHSVRDVRPGFHEDDVVGGSFMDCQRYFYRRWGEMLDQEELVDVATDFLFNVVLYDARASGNTYVAPDSPGESE